MDSRKTTDPNKHQSSTAPTRQRKNSQPCRRSGFTLLEALITLAIATLISLFVPAMRNILIDNRMVVQVNRLVRDMHFARSEAIKQRTQVILCKSRGNARCSAKSHWEEGWIVFADINHDEALDRNERIMRSQGPLEGQTRLRYAGFRSHRFITFYSNGFTNVNGTFTFCDPRGSETARALILSKTGRLRISRTRADGHTPLTCDDDD